MEHATFFPITLAIIGLTLVTLAASKTVVHDSEITEHKVQHLAQPRPVTD